MTNNASNTNNDSNPKMYNKAEIIKLGSDIPCPCGRWKDKPHCPQCGRAKLYARAEKHPALTPSGDVIIDCTTYRCENCATKFNDIDWYFKCHAPIKIDWAATKARFKQQQQEKAIADWIIRIKQNEKFGFNDHTQCRAQTGVDLNSIINNVRDTNRPVSTISKQERIELLKNWIEKAKAGLNDPTDDTAQMRLDMFTKQLADLTENDKT